MTNNEASTYADKALKLLALVSLEGKTQRDRVRLLDRAGFRQSEIANLLGSTPNAISVRLAEIRKEARKTK